MMQTDLDDWFVREILPLEGALMRYLRRNWRDAADLPDLRQEVYVRVYESARTRLPEQPQAFLFASARNLLIDRTRRAQIVSIETLADLEHSDHAVDELTPERHAGGRGELQLLQQALDELPQRCREVVSLRKIDGMSQREVAHHMGIQEATVEKQISKGIRALAESLLAKGVVVGMARASVRLVKKGQP